MGKKVLVCRFPYGASEHPDTVDWLIGAYLHLERAGYEHRSLVINDTPITMTRNRAIDVALAAKVDYVLMVDSDMKPDVLVGVDPEAKPFLPTALEFMEAHPGPCVVAAPYCGPPPNELVYVFHWPNFESDNPNAELRLAMVPREMAAMLSGVQPAAALPTGVMLIDMRAFERLKPPFFYYEWKDGRAMEKASTEDVTFSRDLRLVDVPTYCAWDSWAGHWKTKCVGKPVPYTCDLVNEKLHEAIVARRRAGERLVRVTPAGSAPSSAAEAAAGERDALSL